MNIPFLDLKAQYNLIKPEIDSAIKKVVKSQFFILGSELKAFERKFAKYLGARYAVGVNSGTDALFLALLSLGVRAGDEVIVPVNTFSATVSAVILTGTTPVLIDCDPLTYGIDTKAVEKAITKKTKVLLPVHMYGAPSEIKVLKNLAKKHKLFLLEDAAQAHGSEFKGKKLGTFGDLGAFSFYPGKNMGAYGDGGAIVTNNKKLYDKLIKLRNHGQVKKYFHEEFGINSRLDEIQAAVLSVKLAYLNQWNKKRNKIAEQYLNNLKNYKTQKIIKGGISNYYVFSIESDNRKQLQHYLLSRGIHTLIHYPFPIHLQNAYKHLGYKKGDFPNAEKISQGIISIPIYPELNDKKLKYIINTINGFNK